MVRLSVVPLALGLAAAQFPPRPEGVRTVRSKVHDNVTISYKDASGACESAELAASYAGYVHLPPGLLDDVDGEKQDYPVNTFFYFFEARNNPQDAPLSIWLNGGPGGSSMLGLFQENGPCLVNSDSRTTESNLFSWNNDVNMLYIDQPNHVGFSYDVPTNVSVTMTGDTDSVIQPLDPDAEWHPVNATYRVGTASSGRPSHTANSTAQAAHALWHFVQTWSAEFPHYRPHDGLVSLWTESYGGHYGPGIMRFFQLQNERIANGTIGDEHAHVLHLDTLGIINGFMDSAIQGRAYFDFPYNNTYGIQVFNESVHAELAHNWTRPGGCLEQTRECEARLSRFDTASINRGLVSASDVCDRASWCEENTIGLFASSESDSGPGGAGLYDIAHPLADPFPPPHMNGYLAESRVQAQLGVPVNFTAFSMAVGEAFASTYDNVHGGFLTALGHLLDGGVKVHLVYGDRDYICNWVGGEEASLAVPYSRRDEFASAPYGPFEVDGRLEGITRQLGNYSFTRVFQAGHMVPSYQPRAAHELFRRATFNRDIGTGKVAVGDDLVSEPARGVHRWMPSERPPRPEPECYVLWPSSCTPEVWERVVAGEAVIRDYFVVGFDDSFDEL